MKRGFSLIEVMVTISLVSVVFLILMNLLPATLTSVRQSEHRLAALAVVQNILDHCSAGPFSDLVDGPYTPQTSGPIGAMLAALPTTLDDGTALHPRIQIQGVSGIPRANLASVTVTISWEEKNKHQQMTQELRISCVSR